MSWTMNEVISVRMQRQGLLNPVANPANEDAYIALFKRLQPVAPIFFSRPGDPPSLVHRTLFNDSNVSFYLREKHVIVKARFQDGRVAYVLEDDLKLYATAFRKVPKQMNQIHVDVYQAVKESGGFTKEQLKDELPYTAKEIGSALQALQQAFYLVEEQIDSDWETGWLDFAEQWFEIPTDETSKAEALKEVLLRFVDAMVFASMEQVKSWSGLTTKTIQTLVQTLIAEGKLVNTHIDGLGEGWMTYEDSSISVVKEHNDGSTGIHSTFMLDKSDFLVRADMTQLKKSYTGKEVLQYLLIDGQFKGAVIGHWRIGPHDVEDIIVNLDPEEAEARREEIIDAVKYAYRPDFSKIIAYNGVVI